jgi:hypothetical protein
MNIQNFKHIYDLAIGAITSVGTAMLLGYFNKRLTSKKVSTAIILIIVSVFIMVTNYLLNNIINNNSSFRKWIDPENYIEGYWYETSPPDSNNVILHETFVKIGCLDGAYVVSGETFDTLGNSYANFKSVSSAFYNANLYFQYTSYNQVHGIGQGFDQLQFDNPPVSYKSFIFSSTSKKYYGTNGTRINDELVKTYNKFISIDDKRKFILDKISKAK